MHKHFVALAAFAACAVAGPAMAQTVNDEKCRATAPKDNRLRYRRN